MVSNPLTWQRVRIDPALSRAWTRSGDLVLGFNSIVADKAHQSHDWLALFDGTRSATALIESATAMGIDSAQARLRLEQLANSGAIFQVDTLPAALGNSRIVFDARAVGQQCTRSGLEVAALRQTTRILVRGIGAFCYQAVQQLDELGYLVGWQCDSAQRITLEDIQLGKLPHEWMGRRWSDVGREVVEPQFVIEVNDVIDFATIDMKFARSNVLPVQLRGQEAMIGPLLGHAAEMCGRCIYEAQVAANADWPLLLTQWLHHRRAIPLLSVASLNYVLAQVMVSVEFFASHGISADLGMSLHCSFPEPKWREVTWQRGIASDCSCYK